MKTSQQLVEVAERVAQLWLERFAAEIVDQDQVNTLVLEVDPEVEAGDFALVTSIVGSRFGARRVYGSGKMKCWNMKPSDRRNRHGVKGDCSKITTMYMPVDLDARVRRERITRKMSMSAVMREALELWLKSLSRD